MKKMSMLVAFLILCGIGVQAQEKYFTRTGTVSLNAEGALDDVEEIKAKSTTATSVVDITSGQMEWAVLMKGFQFKNALMQEHFNENYVESDKFPKAAFKGQIDAHSNVKWTTDGTYPVTVNGKMTLHGITRDLVAKGTVQVKGGKPILGSDFVIKLSDYDIKIPSVVGNKIANEVKITVSASLEPFKK